MVPEHAMTEGRVHACSWKRVRGGYRVWLKSDPTIAAEHAQFAEADELLTDLICEATGDGESVHVYDPGLQDVGERADSWRYWLGIQNW